MHNYGFWCPVVTMCALLTTDGRMDGWMDRHQTKTGDISAAEMKAEGHTDNIMHLLSFLSNPLFLAPIDLTKLNIHDLYS